MVWGGRKGKTIRVSRGRGWVLGRRKEKLGSPGGVGGYWEEERKNQGHQGAGIGLV